MLELMLAADFKITARLIANSGHTADVTIVDAKPMSRR